MSKLEELRPNASVQGILPNCLVSVINAQWFGSEALELSDQCSACRAQVHEWKPFGAMFDSKNRIPLARSPAACDAAGVGFGGVAGPFHTPAR